MQRRDVLAASSEQFRPRTSSSRIALSFQHPLGEPGFRRVVVRAAVLMNRPPLTVAA